MVCEAGEVGDILKKHIYHGHELDMDELKKEIGDVMWYMANLCNVLEIELDEIAIMNIEKLKKRYPNGFKVEDSVNREE
jgi:NTP pyrophosphatase (non-canonical NTP hydrolase)